MKRILFKVLGLTLALVLLLPVVVSAVPGVYGDVTGDYTGGVKMKVYLLDQTTYTTRYRYMALAIWEQNDSEIQPVEVPFPGPGATVYLYEYSTDLVPALEIDVAGYVGADTKPSCWLSGVDASGNTALPQKCYLPQKSGSCPKSLSEEGNK